MNTRIEFECRRELAVALAKIGGQIFFEEIPLTVESRKCNTPPAMADQRSADKTILTLWIPRALFHRLKKAAISRNETLTDLVTDLITRATKNVELTPEDFRLIADETEQASKRLSARRAKRKAVKAG